MNTSFHASENDFIKKLIHKPNSGLDLVVRKPKIQKVKEKKKKIIIKVENISPNKIVVCTEMVMYYT
jgi:hypothetical protein